MVLHHVLLQLLLVLEVVHGLVDVLLADPAEDVQVLDALPWVAGLQVVSS